MSNANILGGPFNGYSAKQTINNYKTSDQTIIRKVLRKSWNTPFASGIYNNNKRVITPFRAVNNLGDFLARVNYNCGGPNSVNPSKPGLKDKIGSVILNCDDTGVPGSSCNSKFVADSSDYTRFRKEQMFNNNYNDISFGGDDHNGSYVNKMSVIK